MRYKKRLSGPLLDRIDLHIHVSAVEIDKLTDDQSAESSAVIRKKVQKAREKQQQRYKGTKFRANGEMDSRAVKHYCQLDQECQIILRQAVENLQLTARSYYRTIKVARTIADLDDNENIHPQHLAEALQYRQKVDI